MEGGAYPQLYADRPLQIKTKEKEMSGLTKKVNYKIYLLPYYVLVIQILSTFLFGCLHFYYNM